MGKEKYVMSSPRVKDYVDRKDYDKAYRRWYYENVVKPSRRAKGIKKARTSEDRTLQALQLSERKMQERRDKADAEINSRVEYLEHWEGPDLAVEDSEYLVEKVLRDKNLF